MSKLEATVRKLALDKQSVQKKVKQLEKKLSTYKEQRDRHHENVKAIQKSYQEIEAKKEQKGEEIVAMKQENKKYQELQGNLKSKIATLKKEVTQLKELVHVLNAKRLEQLNEANQDGLSESSLELEE